MCKAVMISTALKIINLFTYWFGLPVVLDEGWDKDVLSANLVSLFFLLFTISSFS